MKDDQADRKPETHNHGHARRSRRITRPRTIVCDIDGVILRHLGKPELQHLSPPEVLPGVIEMFRAWDMEGCHIVLMTGRRRSTRRQTEQQLSKCGIFYDSLVMGVSGGVRVIINDRKPGSMERSAEAVCLQRNWGFVDGSSSLLGQRTSTCCGHEEILEETADYVVKRASVAAGQHSPLRYHRVRHETIHVTKGDMLYIHGPDAEHLTTSRLVPGDFRTIPPGVIHRMGALIDSEYLNISTNHLEDYVLIDDAG